MPLLDLAQRQHDNWIPMAAVEAIAKRLEMAEIRVEVATFYTMFNLKPVGKYFCRPVQPRHAGCAGLVRLCAVLRIAVISGQTAACGRFSLVEVECLGACVNAPILQVNDDFYEI